MCIRDRDARGRSLAPRLGPEALAGSGRRGNPRGGGWDARNVALLAAELHGNFAWDVEPAARLAAEVLGWEGADPDSAAAAAATLRSPHVGWSAPKTAEALTAMRVASAAGPATNEGPDADEVRWDAHGLVAPMCEALVWANTDGECRTFWKFWTSSRFGTCRTRAGW